MCFTFSISEASMSSTDQQQPEGEVKMESKLAGFLKVGRSFIYVFS